MSTTRRTTVNEGDRGTPIRFEIYENDGTPKDVSSWTFTFTMKLLGSASAKIDAEAAVVTNGGSDGKVHYAWGATDLDAPGDYVAWLTATTSGLEINYPQEGRLIVAVQNLP